MIKPRLLKHKLAVPYLQLAELETESKWVQPSNYVQLKEIYKHTTHLTDSMRIERYWHVQNYIIIINI